MFSSIIITIILSYAIIRIYTILHIYLHVSKTEELAELHWVNGLNALEKINSMYFQGISLVKSSRPEVFCKKCVLRNFTKFTGKHLCQSLFFNKETFSLLKKRLWHRCFPVDFAKFLKTPFLTEHLRWLLLTCAFKNKASFIKLE